jgi:type II secretory pathway predicted ATPase ExeA
VWALAGLAAVTGSTGSEKLTVICAALAAILVMTGGKVSANTVMVAARLLTEFPWLLTLTW